MDNVIGVLTSFGLSTSAGLNAYLPLLIVALTARFTKWIELNDTFSALTSWWTIGILIVLLIIEILADKLPVIDSANDIIQTAVRPAAGAILFAANTNAIADIHPVLAIICGLLVAGTVHIAKASARPVVTAATAGTANPIVSTIEDVLSAITAFLSILLPVLLAIVLLLATAFIGRWLWSIRRHRERV